jgi:hypothetical protein
MFSRRKKSWFVRIPHHLNQAVKWTVAPVADASGEPTEFAQRNGRFVDSMPEDETRARVVTLTAAHDGRALIAELTPAEAENLGDALATGAADVRMQNWRHGDGFTSDSNALQAAIDAHKQAQRAARKRASELMRMVWGDLSEATSLTAKGTEFGDWRIMISEDGARADIEAANLAAPVWGAFVVDAVDRHWFHSPGWRKGAEDWASVKPGEYMAQSHRAQYADVLEVGNDRRAVQLVLRSVDVRRVARGLYAMLSAFEED